MSSNVGKLLFGNSNVYDNAPIVGLDLQGWASNSPTFAQVITSYRPKLIIEVGTWKGGSAIHMANTCRALYNNDDFEIVCIDTFLGSVEHWNRIAYSMSFDNGRPDIYKTFISNVIQTNNTKVITPFPVDSHNGQQVLEYYGVLADLIYIDAGHDFDAVVKDIEGYKKLLKPGGILLGDDIHHGPIVDACNKTIPGWAHINDKFFWIKR